MATGQGLTFKVDTKQVDQFLEAAPKKTSIAVLRSIKRGTMAARTEAARTISKDMGLPVSVVRKAVVMTPPNAQTITGVLRVSLKRIPLIHFKAKGPEPSRGKGRGVSYKAGGGRKVLKSAFIATMPSGHRGVFKREGKKRSPIKQRYGPSMGRVADLHRQTIAARGAEAAEAELDRLLNRIFGIK